ncbi:hypothetical protein IM697_00730 [Streptomyces ferrugineus]|uniref:PH domain-containing protein n=1 Tax=Streptomyces ferrugineus TaxID=1413221 RepID=A0A7M2SL88_9ACTN|nr:hypothetical protein [Streptomyces ferrugineus]QOV37034.1 hypothetical protein IM697_00730 [Streptomyces ferrugineus]
MERTRRSERRRQELRERSGRVEDLAATMAAPAQPLRWRSGWRGRVVGAVWCVLYVVLVDRPEGAGWAHPEPGALFFAAWTSLVAAWVFCRIALWRITADREGVFVRRMWSTRFLPWSRLGRVELRKDGMLEFLGVEGAPMAGFFQPPWLARITGRPGVGQHTADTLTAMARHGDLRPAARAARPAAGSALARWAVPVAGGLYVAGELLHR